MSTASESAVPVSAASESVAPESITKKETVEVSKDHESQRESVDTNITTDIATSNLV